MCEFDEQGNYIRIYRKIMDWEWYTDGNTLRVFLHFLLNANWKSNKFKGYEIPRGSLVIGRKKLAGDLKMSEQEIRTAINHLKSTNEITTKTTNKFTIVTLVNYDAYQVLSSESNQQNDQQTTNNQPTTNHTRIKKESNSKELSYDNSSSHKDVERVLSEWNKLPAPIKNVRDMKPNTERYKMLNSRIKEYGVDCVIEAVHKVGASDFLRRGSDNGWQIDFGWFVRPNNFPKVLEGKYDNKGSKPTASYYSVPRDEWDSYMWSDAIKNGFVTQDDYREWRNGTV